MVQEVRPTMAARAVPAPLGEAWVPAQLVHLPLLPSCTFGPGVRPAESFAQWSAGSCFVMGIGVSGTPVARYAVIVQGCRCCSMCYEKDTCTPQEWRQQLAEEEVGWPCLTDGTWWARSSGLSVQSSFTRSRWFPSTAPSSFLS